MLSTEGLNDAVSYVTGWNGYNYVRFEKGQPIVGIDTTAPAKKSLTLVENTVSYRALLEHGVSRTHAEEVINAVDEAFVGWALHRKDQYIKKGTKFNIPYTVEYLQKGLRVFVHLGKRGLIGSGRSSRVTKTIELYTGACFAHKKPNKEFKERVSIDHEYALVSQFKGCSNVIQSICKLQHGILFEYMNAGDLSVFDVQGTHEAERQLIIHQMATGVSQIHQQGLVHRDLRPNNFLCHKTANGKFTVKICDFELAVANDTKNARHDGVAQFFTMSHLRAQKSMLYEGRDTYVPTFSDDLHSLAVTIYKITTGTLPHFCQKLERMYSAPTLTQEKFQQEMDSLADDMRKFTIEHPVSNPLHCLSRDILEATARTGIPN